MWTAILLVVAAAPPEAIQQQSARIVRIQAGSSLGSGTAITASHVHSASHVFRGESAQPVVRFPDGHTSLAVVLGTDPRSDTAIVELSTPHPTLLPVTPAKRLYRETVYYAGHGSDGRLRWSWGPVGERFYGPAEGQTYWAHVRAAEARGGDSGGGCFVVRERQVLYLGNVWGSTTGRTVFVVPSQTRRFLLPWNSRLAAAGLQRDVAMAGLASGGNVWFAGNAGSCQPGGVVVTPPKVGPPGPTGPPGPGPTPEQLAIAIRAYFESNPINVELDYDVISDEVQKRLPPVRIVVDDRGRTTSAEAPLGQPVGVRINLSQPE